MIPLIENENAQRTKKFTKKFQYSYLCACSLWLHDWGKTDQKYCNHFGTLNILAIFDAAAAMSLQLPDSLILQIVGFFLPSDIGDIEYIEASIQILSKPNIDSFQCSDGTWCIQHCTTQVKVSLVI